MLFCQHYQAQETEALHVYLVGRVMQEHPKLYGHPQVIDEYHAECFRAFKRGRCKVCMRTYTNSRST